MADRATQIEALLTGFCDTDGTPLASYDAYIYQEGTTTKATIWTDSDKATPAINPVVLNSYGQSTNPIFVDENYKIVVVPSGGDPGVDAVITYDELNGTIGLLSTEHEADGTHSAGIIADAEVAAGAAIAISKIANLSVEHKSTGYHKDMLFGTTLNGSLQGTADEIMVAFNCYWSGSEWVAHDGGATKPASAVILDRTDQKQYYCYILDTSANWSNTGWDYKTVLNKASEFNAYRAGGSQTITTGSSQVVTLATELFDTNSEYDITTSKYTPTVKGKHFLGFYVQWATTNVADGDLFTAAIAKNGTHIAFVNTYASAASQTLSQFVSVPAIANGSSDYFEARVLQSNGTDRAIIGAQNATAFFGYRLPLTNIL